MEENEHGNGKPASAGEFIELLKQDAAERKIHPAQGYADGVFYYGVLVKGRSFLVSSHRSTMALTEAANHGLTLTQPQVAESRFSPTGLKAYINGEAVGPARAIFDAIVEHLKRHVYLRQPEDYVLLSLWIMGTYVFRCFPAYPYIHLSGEKGSGKTLLMEVMAEIAFNGSLTANSTPAVIYRDIEASSPTMFMDEMENLKKSDKEAYGALMSVLKVGYKASGVVKRCGGQNMDKIYRFSAYCPKMFAGINDMEDVLADRAIQVRIVRQRPKEQREPYTHSATIQALQEQIRDSLYRFGLEHGPTIYRSYHEEHGRIRGAEGLMNRQHDLWAPLLLLANIVDESSDENAQKLTLIITEYAEWHADRRAREDKEENATAKFVVTLNAFIEENITEPNTEGKLCYPTESVLDFFRQQEGYDWLTKHALTRTFRGVFGEGSKPHTINGSSVRCYYVDPDILKEMLERYSPGDQV